MRETTFLHGLHDGNSEAAAEANILVQVKVTATLGVFGPLAYSRDVIAVERKERVSID